MPKQNKVKQFVIIFSFLLMSSLIAVRVHADGFTVVGPGGGGAMFHATVSPYDDREALIACDMTGAYITHDGGHSWRMFNLRGTVRYFAFDPVKRGTIYAGTEALWRSTDDGVSWKLVWPRPSTVRSVYMSSDHADESILSDDNPLGEIVALAIDPADSRVLIAGAVKYGFAAVYISKDAGSSWEKLHDLKVAPMHVWIDPYSNKSARDIYIGGPQGVAAYRSGEWKDLAAPANAQFNDMSAGFSAKDSAVIYGSSNAGIYVSRDGGASWVSSSLPGVGGEVRAIAASLHHPESAYVSFSKLKVDDHDWMGVARTRDGGKTWTLGWKEGKTSSENVQDAWVSQISYDWGENPLGIGVADQNPELSYGTDFGRTLMTTNGGRTWSAAYSKKVAGGNWVSTGLDVTTNYGYMVDPLNANRHFIPSTDIGLLRSEDKGRSWVRSVDGVPEAWTNTTYWMVFDPAMKGKVWGAMSGTHDLPRPKMWRHTPVEHFKGGICLSTNGGQSWKPSNTGMPETAPTHILLDSTSPVGHRTLYAATMGRGVYKSTDDGMTWTQKNNGITQHEPFAWRLARTDGGTLYLVIARRSENGSIGTDGDGALYQSTDGAESWKPVPLPAEVNGPNGIAIDPKDSNRLYLAAWTRATGDHGIGGGIFLSTDGGKNWKHVLDRDQHVYDVTIDPRNGNILYATGFESSAWRSEDRGESWTRIPGYNFKWGHRVVPDPANAEMIYIATFGGGVWHGLAKGDVRQPDIVTPEMEPGKK